MGVAVPIDATRDRAAATRYGVSNLRRIRQSQAGSDVLLGLADHARRTATDIPVRIAQVCYVCFSGNAEAFPLPPQAAIRQGIAAGNVGARAGGRASYRQQISLRGSVLQHAFGGWWCFSWITLKIIRRRGDAC
jgi:hypothetical protein